MTVPVPQRYKYLRSRNAGDSALQLIVESLLFNFRQSNLRGIDNKKGENRPANDKLQLENSVGDTLDFEYLVHPTLSQQYPNSTLSFAVPTPEELVSAMLTLENTRLVGC